MGCAAWPRMALLDVVVERSHNFKGRSGAIGHFLPSPSVKASCFSSQAFGGASDVLRSEGGQLWCLNCRPWLLLCKDGLLLKVLLGRLWPDGLPILMNSIDELICVDDVAVGFRYVSQLGGEFSSSKPFPSSVVAVAQPAPPRGDACLLLLRFNALNLLLDPVQDLLLIVGPKLEWASKLLQVVLQLPPELPAALSLHPVVVDVPIFVVSSVLPSKSCESNACAKVAVGAVVVVAQVSSRVGTLGLPCVLLGSIVATFIGLIVSPPESVAKGLEKVIPQLVDVRCVIQGREIELLICPLKIKLMLPVLRVDMFRSDPFRLWDKTSFRLLLDLVVQDIFQEFVVCVLVLTQGHGCLDAVLKAVVNAVVASPSRGDRLRGIRIVRVVTLVRNLVGVDDVGMQGMCTDEQWVFQWVAVEVPAHEPFARAEAGQALTYVISPGFLVDARTSIGTDEVKARDSHVDPFPILIRMLLREDSRDISAEKDCCTSLGSFVSVIGIR